MIRKVITAREVAERGTWEYDYATRVNPTLMTALLHAAVPVLRHVSWRVVDVAEGYCQSELPLNRESTNQHGTHQAALISLAGDYTGGLALATLLRNVPLAGVHPGNDGNSAALWLASMNVRYKAPSTGHLLATCTIDQADATKIQERYFSGRRVIIPLTVSFTSNGEQVAEAEMTYFAQASEALRPTPAHPKLTTLYKHKLKASARLVAALRSRRPPTTPLTEPSVNRERSPVHRFHCAHSETAAGPHGALLADYLTAVLPQLEDMVVARTQHIDDTLRAAIRSGVRQIVIPGVGLDFRGYRLSAEFPHLRFFETDLPEMLAERERTIAQMANLPPIQREAVPVNFEAESLDEVLLNQTSLDPYQPTAVVYEGCSMYFDAVANARIIGQIRRLLRNPASLLWSDFVTSAVVDGTTQQPSIEEFLRGMEKLGEAFVFGLDEPSSFLTELQFQTVERLFVGDYLALADPVFGTYQFVVARPI